MSLTKHSYMGAVKYLLDYSGLNEFSADLSTVFHQGDYILALHKNIHVDKYDNDISSQLIKFSEDVIDSIENSR